MTSNTDRLLDRIDAVIDGFVRRDPAVSLDAMRCTPMPDASDDSPDGGEVIDVYTRADAIADGCLVEAPADVAREAGLLLPIALTRAAWEDCVAWTDDDNRRKGTVQTLDGRLWDVLWMARSGIASSCRAGADGGRVRFSLFRTPRPGRALAPRLVQLDIVIGPGDDGEPVLTIMQLDED